MRKLELAASLLQSLAGLYIIYRKSTHLTQWLFYSTCATALPMYVHLSSSIWDANATELHLPKEALMNKEHASKNELAFFRGLMIFKVSVSFASRQWVCWRLLVDLKARDARVVRANEQLQEQGSVEKQQGFLDGVVTDKTVDHSQS